MSSGEWVSRRVTPTGATRHRTVADLAEADPDILVAEFGPRLGTWYGELGRGLGSRVVDDTPWVAQGHSREMTYQRDLTDPGQVDDAVRVLARQVMQDVRDDGRPVVRLVLKVRYVPFDTKTFSRDTAGADGRRGCRRAGRRRAGGQKG